MIRATTPIIKFILPAGLYEGSKKILITFKQGTSIVFNKYKEDLIDSTSIAPNRYDIHLTQKETNMFNPNMSLKVQVRFLTTNGEACVSKEKLINVRDVLNDEELK